MRLLLSLLMCAPLLAQQAPAPKAAEAQNPAAADSQWLTGSIDFGFRWSTAVRGNENVYRSVVNLGEGPKLNGLDLTIRDSSHRLFDKVSLRGDSWGGDPYNTLHVDAERDGSYRFWVDYRNISYFDAMPSFADPTIGIGFLQNQRSFDIHRRMIDTQIDLFPKKRIVPYFGYSRDWGSGSGITDFTTSLNEYAVATTLDDKTDTWRGGVRAELNRFHLTLEQGGSLFHDGQSLSHSNTHLGNLTATFLGQRLFLNNLSELYDVNGDNIYSKALFTANPYSWIDLYGQFLYSRPRTEATFSQNNAGNFFTFDQFIFFGAEQHLFASKARRPSTSGSFAVELKPIRRLRVTESVMTDRFHVPASIQTNDDFLRLTPTTPIISSTTDTSPVVSLEYRYNRQEVNVLFDATSRLTLRGGHRYVWGDAVVRASTLSQTGPTESGEVRMQVGLAGLTYRPVQKASIGFDFEAASADRNYFRTGLQDYQKLRARARYQILTTLSFSGNFSLLNNLNPSVANRYQFRNRDYSASLFWTPGGSKWISVLGDYTYSTLRSDINYLIPQDLTTARSLYIETSRAATAVLDVNFPKLMGSSSPKLSLGGSLFSSLGSRPTHYYQPLAKFSVPVYRKVLWTFEWRWYNLGEQLFQFEGFRTHHLMTGLRIAL